VNRVKSFEADYLEYLSLKHRNVLEELGKGVINNDITSILDKAAAEVAIKYRQN
jgi:F-type H+-transporting ATPase subunit alpha